MFYHSTRSDTKFTPSQAIVYGIAPDGGLFVPEFIPQLNYEELLNNTYQEIAAKILSLYFDEFDFNILKSEIEEAYKSFDISEVVGLYTQKDFSFLELYHGPTAAFKDIALVVLPRLIRLAKNKLGINRTSFVLTATSGDTGGATLSGFSDQNDFQVIVLYPSEGVSKFQEAQMQHFNRGNGHVISVLGNFDQCQSSVKKYFSDHNDYDLCSANSINVGRLVSQIVYYFYSYVYLVNNNFIKKDELVNFIVPTGNFGNILAGYLSKRMGLPVNDLICATNENCVLTDFFNSNTYSIKREFIKTNSPSMDILISSNLERYLYFETGSINKVKKYMSDLSSNKEYSTDICNGFIKSFSTDQIKTCCEISRCYYENNYLIDPHTAVAYSAFKQFRHNYDNCYSVVVSTASPIKFSDTVLSSFTDEKTKNKVQKELDLIKNSKFKYGHFNKTDIPIELIDKTITEIIKCYM